uniref:Uncharacterized protein n=1 Tax=Triticum urartu TaxID=4572 RepID=A0A8R7PM46_TRIUA
MVYLPQHNYLHCPSGGWSTGQRSGRDGVELRRRGRRLATGNRAREEARYVLSRVFSLRVFLLPCVCLFPEWIHATKFLDK